jgi:hypothetical protein
MADPFPANLRLYPIDADSQPKSQLKVELTLRRDRVRWIPISKSAMKRTLTNWCRCVWVFGLMIVTPNCPDHDLATRRKDPEPLSAFFTPTGAVYTRARKFGLEDDGMVRHNHRSPKQRTNAMLSNPFDLRKLAKQYLQLQSLRQRVRIAESQKSANPAMVKLSAPPSFA